MFVAKANIWNDFFWSDEIKLNFLAFLKMLCLLGNPTQHLEYSNPTVKHGDHGVNAFLQQKHGVVRVDGKMDG